MQTSSISRHALIEFRTSVQSIKNKLLEIIMQLTSKSIHLMSRTSSILFQLVISLTVVRTTRGAGVKVEDSIFSRWADGTRKSLPSGHSMLLRPRGIAARYPPYLVDHRCLVDMTVHKSSQDAKGALS
ncbi:unnamed protein product [Somion occarium]|uniref:Uncharacterized protein n=1 Tax=Somion occarium TaxID=3059160 RepID=A0ABP1CL19_9APHY